MQKRIITISREFGSGGHTVGARVAEALGYAFYDKEIIEHVAEETGLSRAFIEEQGEESPAKSAFAYSFLGRNAAGMSLEDYLFASQRKLILELADKSPCVIVGRCADYILKGRTDCLNVFVHADKEFRAARIVEQYGETDRSPEKRIREKDKKRAINYKYYTEQEWGSANNYDLCIDTGTLGIDVAVDVIVSVAKSDR